MASRPNPGKSCGQFSMFFLDWESQSLANQKLGLRKSRPIPIPKKISQITGAANELTCKHQLRNFKSDWHVPIRKKKWKIPPRKTTPRANESPNLVVTLRGISGLRLTPLRHRGASRIISIDSDNTRTYFLFDKKSFLVPKDCLHSTSLVEVW